MAQTPFPFNPSRPYPFPFDYQHPTALELEPFLGDSWGICRETPHNLARYKRCVSLKAYEKACAQAIEARGYARPVEKTLLDLLNLLMIHNPQAIHLPKVAAAHEVLKLARIP